MTSEQIAVSTAVSTLGAWFLAKWRGRVSDSGDVGHVARMMRKSGIPLEIALIVLARRRGAQ